MGKRIQSIFLVFAMLISILPGLAFATNSSNNEWEPLIVLQGIAKNSKTIELKWTTRNIFSTTYKVYGAQVNKLLPSGSKSLKYVGKSINSTMSVSKINGKALKSGEYYQFEVRASVDNKTVSSNQIIVIGNGYNSSYGNVDSLSVKDKTKTIYVNDKYTLQSPIVGTIKSRKTVKLLPEFRFVSDDESVAMVDQSLGKITGIAEGKCYIYCITPNGMNSATMLTVNKHESPQPQSQPQPVTKTEYSITVNGGINGNAIANAQTSEQGKNISLIAVANEGYKFKSWQSDDVEISGNSFTMPTKDVSITAQWETMALVDEYDITVDSGDHGKAIANAIKSKSGETISLVAVPNEGYEFDEWISDDVTISGDSFTMPAKAVTVTAKWKAVASENAYKVTVNGGTSGNAIADSKEAKYGETINLIAVPNRGYIFKSWQSDDVEISGNSFIMPAKNVSIAVEWEIDVAEPDASGDGLTIEKADGKFGVKDGGITKSKIDASANVVFEEDEQTLKNKTISASDNSILNLSHLNFANGVLQTSMPATPNDISWLTTSGLKTELDKKVNISQKIAGLSLENNISADSLVTALKDDIRDMFFPVGTMYYSLDKDFNPNTSWGGTWEKIGEGYFTEATETSSNVGTTHDAGLPNIMGAYGSVTYANKVSAIANIEKEGAFTTETNRTFNQHNFYADPDDQSTGYTHYKLGFSAANGECGIQTDNTTVPTFDNKVYGKSDTVQPKSIMAYIWKRTN